MKRVRNPGPHSHRIGFAGSTVYFPVGEVVECDDLLAAWVVANMRFERVGEKQAAADDTAPRAHEGTQSPSVVPAAVEARKTKPAQGKRK